MPISKRAFLGGGLGALTLPAGGPIAVAQSDSTLLIGSTQVPRHFNGAIQSGVATAGVSTQVFASPLRFDDKWNPQPYLARSWEVAKDGLMVTLRLEPEVEFHDGTKLTSEDVKFSIEIIKAHHPFKTMLEPVAAVDTPDATTVVIHLSRPHPALLLAMSPALMPILPKHIYSTGDIQTNPANLKPIGCGPYRLVNYRQGESIELRKFEKFFIPGRPKLDKIIVRIVADEAALTLATERGDYNLTPFLVGVRNIDRLSKSPKLFVTPKGHEGIGPLNWLAFNTGKKPLDDGRVRRAIAYAANRDFVIAKLMNGKAAPAYGPIVPTSPLANPDVETYKTDLAKAEQLLDEADHKKGADGNRFTLTIDYLPGGDEQQKNVAEYLRAQLKRIGIAIDVRSAPDFPTWAQRVSNFDFDLTMDVVFNWGDPVIGVARTYLTSNIRKGVIWSNTQQYSNPKVDRLLEQAAVENDPSKRKALYGEFQKIVVDDAPIYYVNVVPYHTAFDKRLTNLPLSIWGVMSPLDELNWTA